MSNPKNDSEIKDEIKKEGEAAIRMSVLDMVDDARLGRGGTAGAGGGDVENPSSDPAKAKTDAEIKEAALNIGIGSNAVNEQLDSDEQLKRKLREERDRAAGVGGNNDPEVGSTTRLVAPSAPSVGGASVMTTEQPQEGAPPARAATTELVTARLVDKDNNAAAAAAAAANGAGPTNGASRGESNVVGSDLVVEATSDSFFSKLNDPKVQGLLAVMILVLIGLLFALLFATGVLDSGSGGDAKPLLDGTAGDAGSSSFVPLPKYSTCGTKSKKFVDYIGPMNVTISGKTCQSWSATEPHEHEFIDLEMNYCRNPDGEPTVWYVFVLDNTRARR